MTIQERHGCIFCKKSRLLLNIFKRFKACVVNETWRTMKNPQTDPVGEYCSKVFDIFCETHGICKELITAYTPQQNGVTKRKNRTILNMVCSLLSQGRVPMEFWPKKVNWNILSCIEVPLLLFEIWHLKRLGVEGNLQ